MALRGPPGSVFGPQVITVAPSGMVLGCMRRRDSRTEQPPEILQRCGRGRGGRRWRRRGRGVGRVGAASDKPHRQGDDEHGGDCECREQLAPLRNGTRGEQANEIRCCAVGLGPASSVWGGGSSRSAGGAAGAEGGEGEYRAGRGREVAGGGVAVSGILGQRLGDHAVQLW